VVHRVLVIDDNEAFRETLVELLTSETPWVTVTAAANGRVALELLNGGLEPCLAFLDLKMPVMSGWEFLDEVRMRNLASGMQVVLVSGFVEQAHEVQYPGILALLPKPLPVRDLVRFVSSVCPPAPGAAGSLG
jgi:CheY-like chemotaxis protein